MELLLQQAYTKFKSHLYSDKTLLAEKIELAQFENDLEKNLKAMLTIGNAFHITIGYSDHKKDLEME